MISGSHAIFEISIFLPVWWPLSSMTFLTFGLFFLYPGQTTLRRQTALPRAVSHEHRAENDGGLKRKKKTHKKSFQSAPHNPCLEVRIHDAGGGVGDGTQKK